EGGHAERHDLARSPGEREGALEHRSARRRRQGDHRVGRPGRPQGPHLRGGEAGRAGHHRAGTAGQRRHPKLRIAVSGAHRTGKTTLVEELVRLLPTYTAIAEPYYFLEEEGHEFAEMPSLEDFELQLERSMKLLAEDGEDLIFDRCPASIL